MIKRKGAGLTITDFKFDSRFGRYQIVSTKMDNCLRTDEVGLSRYITNQ